MSILITIGIFFILVLLGAPLLVAFLAGSIIPLELFTNTPLTVVAQKMYASINSFTYLAAPFFMVSGALMDKGGIATRLVNLAKALVGWMPGSLAVCTFLACAFFGAVSGSSVATVAAIGGIMLPIMMKEGYPLRFTLATVTAGGYLGIIIPPSIPMVLYGMTCGVSIADMFTAGFAPGILLTAGMSVYAVIWGSKHKDIVKRYPFSLKEVGRAFKDAIWAILMPVIILGGIYSGICTPTEAAVIACLYGLFVGFVVYKQLTIKKCIEIMRSSVASSVIIMVCIAAVTTFSFVINMENANQLLRELIHSLAHTPAQFWFVMTIALLIIGMFIDTPPAILLVGTLIMPILADYNIDPLVFGLVMIVNLGIGLCTPPVGMNIYMAKTLLPNLETKHVLSKHLLAYIICSIAIMIVLMCFPGIITFLPALFN